MGKCVDAHIVYGTKNTIWIDSLLQRSKLNSIEKNVVNFSLGHFLKSSPSSVESEKLPSFLVKLNYAYNKPFKSICQKTPRDCLLKAQMCEFSKEYLHINVITKDDIASTIENLINHEITSITKNQDYIQHYRIHQLCLAKFADQEWYRARILKFHDSNPPTYDVYMIDIGEMVENLQMESIASLSDELSGFPDRAIKCSIFGADFSIFNVINEHIEKQHESVFEYLDSLHANLYVLFDCKKHEASGLHNVHLFYHADNFDYKGGCHDLKEVQNNKLKNKNQQNDNGNQNSSFNGKFINVLFDLLTRFDILPTTELKNVAI